MNSSMVNKIVKAKQYAQDPSRVTFRSLEVDFEGDNDRHRIAFTNGTWTCTCDFFSSCGICSHTMAMERILGAMLKANQQIAEAATV